MSLPSSPAPIYHPNSTFQTKVKLNNKALESLEPNLRRVASVPNTKEYFASTNSIHSTPVNSPKLKPSYSLQKQQAQVGPSDFEKIRLLGKGDVGKVYLVKHKTTDKLYALKGAVCVCVCRLYM